VPKTLQFNKLGVIPKKNTIGAGTMLGLVQKLVDGIKEWNREVRPHHILDDEFITRVANSTREAGV